MLKELESLKKDIYQIALDYDYDTNILSLMNKIEIYKDIIEEYNTIDGFIYDIIYEKPDYEKNYETGKIYSYALDRDLEDDEYYKIRYVAADYGFTYLNHTPFGINSKKNLDGLANYAQRRENNQCYLEFKEYIIYNIILDKVIEEYKKNNIGVKLDLQKVDSSILKAMKDNEVIKDSKYDIRDIEVKCNKLKDIAKNVLEMSKEQSFVM